MGKRISEKVKIEVIGNNATDVTGSCIRFTFLGKTYLCECGAVQGYSLDKCFSLNAQLINEINAENLEAIFACHLHMDHMGLIPAITKKKNFHGKVISTYETMELSKLMLLDSAYIMKKDAETLSKTHKGKVKPLYNEEDVYTCYNATEAYDVDKIYEINENVSFRFLRNSHCLGAVQLELFFKSPSNKVKKVLVTSDLGGDHLSHKPFITDLEHCKTANIVFMESTYGCKDRSFSKQDIIDGKKEIKDTILRTIKRGGKVLLPCFSFARTQEVLKDLYDMFAESGELGDIPVIIDSKLSVEVTQTYKKILEGEDLELINKITDWKNVKMNKNIDGTLMNLSKDSPFIVLSSQGFLQAGRSQLYAKHFLGDRRNSIIFVGYCSPGSVGGNIMDDNIKYVKIGDRTYVKECEVKTYSIYSSHMQNRELVNYAKSINCEKIVLVHGSENAKKELQEDIINSLQEMGKTTNIIICKKRLTFEI